MAIDYLNRLLPKAWYYNSALPENKIIHNAKVRAGVKLAIVFAAFFLFIGCRKEQDSDNGSPLTLAKGSLKDLSGDCMTITTNGKYVKNTAFTDSNYVVVRVNFITPGSYSISTDTSNGFSFQSSGTTAGSGMQSITLKGIGKPATAGLTTFSVTFDTSICTFSINVSDSFIIPETTSNDYFPTTAGSNWTYQHMGALDYPYDVTVSPADTIIAGNSYKIFILTWLDYTNSYEKAENYYRKGDGLYYNYGYINEYSINLIVNDKVEFIFLKDNVPLNSTWESPEVNATLNSVSGKLKTKFTISSKDVQIFSDPATLDSVITVKREFMFAPSSTGTYVSGDSATFYYAKNIGFINAQGTYGPPALGDFVTGWEIF